MNLKMYVAKGRRDKRDPRGESRRLRLNRKLRQDGSDVPVAPVTVRQLSPAELEAHRARLAQARAARGVQVSL